MDNFLKWFFEFISEMLKGFEIIFQGIGRGIIKIFNIKNYIKIFKTHSAKFSTAEWILAILAIVIVAAVYLLAFLLVIMVVRKYVRFIHSIVSNENLL